MGMKRRDFISLIGGAAASLPRSTRAQKPPLPVIGYLNVRPETAHDAPFVKGINQALAEMGLVEGRNFTSEYRFAIDTGSCCPGWPLIWFGEMSPSSLPHQWLKLWLPKQLQIQSRLFLLLVPTRSQQALSRA